MPRFRAVILSLLMLAVCLAGSEAWLKYQQSPEVVFAFGEHSYWGWQPDAHFYWQPPRNQSWIYRRTDGVAIELAYDDQGFRRSSATDTASANIICLGDASLLSPQLPASQLLTTYWQTEIEKQNPAFKPTEIIANGGLPLGSPLLWWLQKDRIFSTKSQLVVAFVSHQSLTNDAELRRRAEFDSQGFPVSAKHPAASVSDKVPTGGAQASTVTKLDSLKNSCLIKWGLPQLGKLFSDSHLPGSAEQPFTRQNLTARQIQQAFDPLRWLQKEIQNRQGNLLLVYLPDTEELEQAAASLTSSQENVGFSPQNPLQQIPDFSLRSYLSELANQQQFPFIDLTPLLSRFPEQGKTVWSAEGGLSTEGHRMIAEILSQTVPAN